MASNETKRAVDELIDDVLNSDEVREAELVYALIRGEKSGHCRSHLQEVVDDHLYQYLDTPNWERIVDTLVDHLALKSAHIIVHLHASDEDLFAQLKVRCLLRIFSLGRPIKLLPRTN